MTVMPSIFALTLQMPRGNTETIYPRALVLAGVRKYIENKRYKSAYLACRSHMVDMNILHDYAPDQFMENISLFIDQVKKVEFIDEFLSRLKYVPSPRIQLTVLTTSLGTRMCAKLCIRIHSRLLILVNEQLKPPTKPMAHKSCQPVWVCLRRRAK